MERQRLFLECSSCGAAKFIDVAVRDDGVLGFVKCDECKGRDILKRSTARPLPRRTPVSDEPARTKTAITTSSDRLRRLRSVAADLLGSTSTARQA
jgi:hypothetical protein